MASVTIAIPSFRRPQGLARLLRSLAALETAVPVRVLVGDNDAGGRAAADLCAAMAADYRWPLDAIVVGERGIAQNRSALVAKALSDPAMTHMAMLDDDEFVAPQWLSAMLGTAAEFSADAVEGPVFGVDEAGEAVADYAGAASHRGASGPSEILVGAGNILLTRSIIERIPAPHFDPAFGLTGGEDRDFFLRLAAAGARFAWCAEAQCHTLVPGTRQGLAWTLARAFRNGNSDMRVFLKYHSGFGTRCGEIGRSVAALVAAPLAALALAAYRDRSLAMLRRGFRAAGKLAALFGVVSREYAVTHGQ